MKFRVIAIFLILLAQLILIPSLCHTFCQAPADNETRVKTQALFYGGLLLLLSSAACLISILAIKKLLDSDRHCRSKLLAVLDAEAEAEALAKPQSQQESLQNLTESLIKELEGAKMREGLIADYSSELLCCLNSERKFLELNLQAEKLLGYPSATLLGNKIESIIFAEDLEPMIAWLENTKTLPAESIFESRARRQSGQIIDLEWQCEWSQNLECYFCLAKDISFRKENQRLKAEISAMITHDLRAPITGISYALESLEHGIYGKLPERASLEMLSCQESVRKVLELINQLLDAEKLEVGKMTADLKVVPLSEVYENCRAMLGGLAAAKKQRLSFPESETLVFADFELLNQAYCNLVSNAIKFSTEGKTVCTEEKIRGASVSINVIDNGPGIAESHLPLIFERFKSIKSSETGKLASSGLGLYIAKKLVELQGGNLGVESTPGQGSRFWITLRLASEADLPGFD